MDCQTAATTYFNVRHKMVEVSFIVWSHTTVKEGNHVQKNDYICSGVNEHFGGDR
jgi:hypothetical protein